MNQWLSQLLRQATSREIAWTCEHERVYMPSNKRLHVAHAGQPCTFVDSIRLDTRQPDKCWITGHQIGNGQGEYEYPYDLGMFVTRPADFGFRR